MNLELLAMRWLWLDHGCHYVIEQRSPRYHNGEPDVMGVTKARNLTEIEIKRSLSDFKADAKKHHRANREFHLDQQPRQIYYLVPPALVEKVLPHLPQWAGLMTSEQEVRIRVVKTAPVNSASKPLSVKECIKLARQMVAHMMTYAQHCEQHHSRFKYRDDLSHVEYYSHRNGTWQI